MNKLLKTTHLTQRIKRVSTTSKDLDKPANETQTHRRQVTRRARRATLQRTARNSEEVQQTAIVDLRSDHKISRESSIHGDYLLLLFLNLNVTGPVKRVTDVKKMEFQLWFLYQFAE